jgi:hypothetical protein
MLPFGSPMTRQAVIAALLLVLLATSTGCFEHPSQAVVRQSAGKCAPAGGFGGANEQRLPASFPKDFPVYTGARFIAGTHSERLTTATWTSSAAKSNLRDFYEKELQSGDWQLFGVQYSDPCLAYWHVERRSDTSYGGFVSVYSGAGSAGSSFISADLGKK